MIFPSISIRYIRKSLFSNFESVIPRADLVSQDDLDGRVVFYRDSFNYIVEEDNYEKEDSPYDKNDINKISDILSEYSGLDSEGNHIFPDWYIVE